MIPKTAGRFNHTREDSPRTPCDECAPPGFVDFVSAVRKRLEPFNVEVRFEIETMFGKDEIVRVFAGSRSVPGLRETQSIATRHLTEDRPAIDYKIATICSEIVRSMQDTVATMPEDKINGRFYPKPLTITVSGETSDPIVATVIDLRPTRNMTTGEKIAEQEIECQPLIVNGE